MKLLPIVCNRNGRAAIHWPGVLLAVLVFSAIWAAGVAIVWLATGWYPSSWLTGLALSTSAILGPGMHRGLQSPPSELPPAD